MEELKVREWMKVDKRFGYGSGFGSGFGSGSEYGSGSGYGSGDGSGSEYGSGYGSGYGSADGYGEGIKSFNGQNVYMIDNIQTIITSIHLNLAKGFVLKNDLTLKPCYVMKGDGLFAHGETQREAQEDLQKKDIQYYGHG